MQEKALLTKRPRTCLTNACPLSFAQSEEAATTRHRTVRAVTRPATSPGPVCTHPRHPVIRARLVTTRPPTTHSHGERTYARRRRRFCTHTCFRDLRERSLFLRASWPMSKKPLKDPSSVLTQSFLTMPKTMSSRPWSAMHILASYRARALVTLCLRA